jgi:hypothetical protein
VITHLSDDIKVIAIINRSSIAELYRAWLPSLRH